MSYEEIASSGKEMLGADDVAELLGVAPQGIRVQAKEDPGKLGFHVCVVGTRVLIPRRAILEWIGTN